jgi:hypothetical protein
MKTRTTSRARATTAVVAVVGVFGAGACDILIGIEELRPAPPDEGIECETPADCPATGNPCFLRACTSSGVCEIREVEPGYVPPDPIDGDCLRDVCNGGEATSEPDAADALSDGNECTIESCSAEGQPLQENASAGTVCPGGIGVCDGNGVCVECVSPVDCGGQDCVDFQCIGAGCDDGSLNGNETDVDCGGGDCPLCEVDDDCDVGEDCASGVCNGTCLAPTCNDDTMNGNETDVDCGGSCPTDCGLNHMCKVNGDCVSLFCKCVVDDCTCQTASCDDGVENGGEIDVDCGPLCEGTCADGNQCLEGSWCISGVCDLGDGVCAPPNCDDGQLNGSEDLVDCCFAANPTEYCDECPTCG